MHAKLLPPRLLLAVSGLLFFFPLACAATATFKKIADFSTPMPAGLNPDQTFTQFDKIVALDFISIPRPTSILTFSGRTPSRFGMYNFNDPRPIASPLLVPVAQNQLAPPPAATFYGGFGHLSAELGELAFATAFSGGGLSNGIVKGAPGNFSIVATGSTLMPGYANTFGSFQEVSMSNGQVVWRSQSAAGSGETGVYSDLGGIHAVALPGALVPGLPGGTFTALANFPTVVADGSDIIFYANSSSPSVFSHNGIYKSAGGVLSMVMDSNTSRPGAPSEKFAGPFRLAMHQGGIAFAGEWADLTVFPQVRTEGVYSTVGGLHTVADTHMLAPGAGTPFTLFSDNDGAEGGGVAIFEDVVAFVAYTDSPIPFTPRVPGIYLAKGGGTVKKLLAGGDSLGGKTIRDLSIRRESLNTNPLGGYSLAFWIQFTDFTEAIYRSDFGAPVRKGIAGTGNIAVLRQGSILIEMRDPVGGAPLGTISFLDDGYVPISAAALPDSDGNGVAELAVLAERISDGRPVVEVRNISGTEAPRKIWFAPDANAMAMSVIGSDADNNGIAEIAVLATRNSDGRGRVEIRNAYGATNTQTVYSSAGLTPLGLEVVEDADGNGVAEVAILSMRNSDGRTVVEVVNANGTLNRHSVYYMPGATAVDFAVVNDADNNAVPEIAVLSSRNSDQRSLVEVKNAAGATNPVTHWITAGYEASAVRSMVDADGNAVPEIAVLATRNSDGRIVVDIRNAVGDPNLNRIFYSPGFGARSLVSLGDLDGNSVPEAGVVMIRDSDGRILVQRRNAAGAPTATNYWLAP